MLSDLFESDDLIRPVAAFLLRFSFTSKLSEPVKPLIGWGSKSGVARRRPDRALCVFQICVHAPSHLVGSLRQTDVLQKHGKL